MIFLVVRPEGDFSIRDWLAYEGSALSDRMRIVHYAELARLRHLPLGTWVFTELDRLDAPQRDLVAIAWERLRSAHADVRLMNHPGQVLLRHDLLRATHKAGINRFQAWPATHILFGVRAGNTAHGPEATPATALRYPVFVRFANRHTGNLTPLLDSPRTLESALASLVAARVRLDELLVVEFCDTRDEHGIYRKYSAYRVGDRIVPRYLECSRDWMVKWDARIFDRERAEEETCYLETNPHEAWIREVFRLASIEYGRVDYGVLAGQPQLWEINTNPTIGRGPGPRTAQPERIVTYKQMLAPAFAAFYRNFQEAWEAVDSRADCSSSVELRAPSALLRAIDSAARQRRRADRINSLVDSLVRQRWLRPMTRAVRRALASVATTRLRLGG